MTDPVVPKGMISIIDRATKAFAAHEAKEVRALRQLADRKFREITATHKLFLKLMNELKRAARAAQTDLRRPNAAVATLGREILIVEKAREKNKAERRAQRECMAKASYWIAGS